MTDILLRLGLSGSHFHLAIVHPDPYSSLGSRRAC
jgi:hypothetical protein